jgi:16S rRNA G966 N2-methylase RsmD
MCNCKLSTIEEFIKKHRLDDVRSLALQAAKYPDIDMPFALDQIEGWQRARTKLPEWASKEGIIFPPHISMEQCSSEATAKFKSGIIKSSGTLIDLTGGFGVDFSYMAKDFSKAVYVERQAHLCDIAKHNFELLGLNHADVVNTDGVEYLHSLPLISNASRQHLEESVVIYLDPARRDVHGAKVYGIEDCTPNVVELQSELLDKASVVMVKLSPMLDLHAAIKALSVSKAYIVSVGNECKELLLVLSRDKNEAIRVVCVNDDGSFEYSYGEEADSVPSVSDADILADGSECFLYEPNASIMKAGCFSLLTSCFSVKALSRNSHLFVSNDEIADFPGRKFKIYAVSSMNKKELRKVLADISQANIAVRNFPLSVAELRKRLKLKDGGDTYIFATTVGERSHTLIICKKIG